MNMLKFKEFRTIVKTDDTESINSIPIESSRLVLNHICGVVDRSILLTKNLSIELTNLFGKYNLTKRTEFFNKIWICNYFFTNIS